MTSPSRPVLRWHGGKWRLAPWIISHFPKHRVYVEPFGGAASVLLRKDRSYAEIYNDLDDEVVNLFRVLRDLRRAELLRNMLECTPFSRTEFLECYRPTRNTVERARRLIVRSFMGFGSDGSTSVYRTGFRSASNRSHTTPAHDWRNFAPALGAIIERIAGVVIENEPAIDVMRRHDGPDTLHYIDPPYLPETRRRANRRPGGNEAGVYRHELSTDDHAHLLEELRGLKGMVAISGYPSRLYDQRLFDWNRVERQAYADGASKRTEVLWLNSTLTEALNAEKEQPLLFGGAA